MANVPERGPQARYKYVFFSGLRFSPLLGCPTFDPHHFPAFFRTFGSSSQSYQRSSSNPSWHPSRSTKITWLETGEGKTPCKTVEKKTKEQGPNKTPTKSRQMCFVVFWVSKRETLKIVCVCVCVCMFPFFWGGDWLFCFDFWLCV